MSRIIVSEAEVWNYFQDCKDDLKSHMHKIAENTEYGIEIFVTEDSGLPSIVVTADNVQVFEETAVSENDCKKTASEIFDSYLTSKVIATLLGGETKDEPTEVDIEDTIAEREEELDCLMWDFFTGLTDGAYIDGIDLDTVLEDCKEHFLEYIARKHGILIYRPMILEYEDGTEEVEDYPYEHMEFDDEDNPIYK